MRIEGSTPLFDSDEEALVQSTEQLIILVPCSGLSDRGIPRGPVYVARLKGVEQGTFSLDEARSKYPDAKISISDDALCDSCHAILVEAARPK